MAQASTGKTVVHIKVGGYMDDGQPPFLPNQEVLDQIADEWQEALGDDYVVIATHFMVEVLFYDEQECDCQC